MVRMITGRYEAVRRLLLGVALLLILGGTAAAQTNGQVVTLQDVLQHAQIHSPIMVLADVERALGAEQAKEIVGPLQSLMTVEAGATKVDQTQRFDPICFEYEGEEICLPPEDVVKPEDLKLQLNF